MKRLLGLALLCAGLALAQNPKEFFNWWNSPITREINLTPDQRIQIQGIVREYRNRLIDERAAVQKAEADLSDVINADNYDLKRANEALDRFAAARHDLLVTFSQMNLRLRGVLTHEQWQELQRRRPLRNQPGGKLQTPSQ